MKRVFNQWIRTVRDMNFKSRILKNTRGQGMVEFALTIPIILVLMLGVIEFGRLLFVYTSITSAGREAARYGSAVGSNPSGTPYYDDCAGMRAAAMRIGQFAGIKETDIKIFHDTGPTDTNPTPYCDGSTDTYALKAAERILVNIDILYTPISPLVNLPSFHLYSNNAHSILKEAEVVAKDVTVSGGGQVCNVTKFKFESQSSPLGDTDVIVLNNLNVGDTTTKITGILIVWDTTSGPKLVSIADLKPGTDPSVLSPTPISPANPGPYYDLKPVDWNFPSGKSIFSISFDAKLKSNVIIRLTTNNKATNGIDYCAFGQ